MAKVTRLANLPEVLLRYRLHNSQVTKFLKDSESQSIRNILAENFLGRTLTPHEKDCHKSLFLAKPYADTKRQQDVEQWVGFLEKRNVVHKVYAEPIFSRTIRQQCFYYSIRNNKRYCPFLLFRFFLAKQKYFLCFSVMELLKICVKCFMLWPNKKFQGKRNTTS